MSAILSVPTEVVTLACRAFYDTAGVHWDTLSEFDQKNAQVCMAAALRAVGEWASTQEDPSQQGARA